MPVTTGRPAPWFRAATRSNPAYMFNTIAGRYVLMAFLPTDAALRDRMVQELRAHSGLLSSRIVAFGITRDAGFFETLEDTRTLKWFLDADGEINRRYGAVRPDGQEGPHWLLLDPALRGLDIARADDSARIFERMRGLPMPDDHAGVPLHAPVLIVPRVFEPQFCRRLIDLYEATGGRPSGVMREIDGKTVEVRDDYKSRRDVHIEDEALRAEVRGFIQANLLPEIEKVFQFKVTRMERHLIACYDADEGGYFRAHRDNTTPGTAHRRFACSINLNAEEFDGGDLRFPEFGSRTYRPPTGGAVIFSCSLLHEATPVTRGRRYAYLPFFYDEAGDVIRKANLANVQLIAD